MWEGEEKEIEFLGAGTLCLRPWPLDSGSARGTSEILKNECGGQEVPRGGLC